MIGEVLAEKLGRPVSAADIGMSDPADAVLLGAASYPHSLSESIAAVRAVAQADRPGGPALDVAEVSAWADLMVQWLLAPDCATSPTEAARSSVVGLQLATEMFTRLDYQLGGGYARTALVEYIRSEVSPLLTDEAETSPELLRAAATLLRLAGWTAYDTGHHGLADRYLAQALRLAQEAGDRALGGRILAGMSHQANVLGYHDQAANLARTAQRGARGQATPTAMSLFHAMEARALAGAGDGRGAEAALVAAESWFDRRSPDNDPPWLRYFDSAELAAEFAHSYRDLGVADKTIECGLIAVNDADPLYARSIAFCESVTAAGYLLAGDVEHGVTAANRAAIATTTLRSVRSRAYLDDLQDRLRPFAGLHPVDDLVIRGLLGAPTG